MNVGIVSYYKISLIKESEGKFKRENGNRRWLQFYEYLASQNSQIELYESKNHNKYDVILVREIPRFEAILKLKINNFFKKKIPLILLLEESPLARSRHSLLIGGIYDEVYVASNQKNYKFKNYKTKNFLYGNIPDINEIKSTKKLFTAENRKKLLCYISSNRASINPQSTYSQRYNLVKSLNHAYHSKFDLYGFGWNRFVIPVDLPFIAILLKLSSLINFLFNPLIPKIYSKGQIDSKKSVMKKYQFCLAIEPYLGSPFCVMEKIFDPMLAGCIPVYIGFRSEVLGVPENTYIQINRNIKADQLINILESYPEEELIKIRENIWNYLISKKAEKYRYDTFAKFLFNSLKKIAKKSKS